MLLKAASMTESAMPDSTSRLGRSTYPSTARLSVTECETVNPEITLISSTTAGQKSSTGFQRPGSKRVTGRRRHTRKGGSNRDRNESRRTGPVQVCRKPVNHKVLNWVQRFGRLMSRVVVGS